MANELDRIVVVKIAEAIQRNDDMDAIAANALIDQLPPENYPPWKITSLSTKYQRETVAKLISALCRGASRQEAVNEAGITYGTFAKWLTDDDKPEFKDWIVQALEYRRELSRERHRNNIEAHSYGDWRASAWMLERLDPQNFGASMNLNVQGGLSTVANMTFEQAYMLKYGKPPEYGDTNAANDLSNGDTGAPASE